MSRVIDIGGIRITALNDGTVRLPPMYYPGLDFAVHPELVESDGTYHLPIGSFLIQADGATILVDAGIGPRSIPFPADIANAAGLEHPPADIATGGLLPEALAAAGVVPADITAVFLTHLDADHVGWIAVDDALFFPDAEVVCSAIDLAVPPGSAPGEAEGRAGLAVAQGAGQLRPVDAAAVELAPGVTARHAPGHTPGHFIVVVSARGQEARMFGDAVHHPLQLNDTGISFLLESDPGHALRTREALLADAQDRGVWVNMAHFPGLAFHRISVERGQRRWVPA
ncbi:MAG: MBL fold metallo-hydrolase [Nocardiopsaceae bacterium]|nr:MBL fold metallo-hydrolase [Nocardiopsaceae bacterium]